MSVLTADEHGPAMANMAPRAQEKLVEESFAFAVCFGF